MKQYHPPKKILSKTGKKKKSLNNNLKRKNN